MFTLERILQFHTAALVILGAAFVARGHENPWTPGLLVVAALAGVCLTDVLRWLRLNRLIANGIAMIAVAWTLRGFFEMASDGKLMAIADMLCYLQIVLLFQEKTARLYWQLIVLSVLQVVVAAALDVGPEFGALLAIYAAIALSTLVLLCIYRDLKREGKAADSLLARLIPFIAMIRGRPASPAAQRGAAWRPLLATPVVAHGRPVELQIYRDLPARTVIRQTALLAGVTFLFAIVFFYVTPRLNESAWQSQGKAWGGTTGFRNDVRLAERGRIHLSGQPVMRVSLTRMNDRRPVALVGEPYFHGTVLTEYIRDEKGSRWLPGNGPLPSSRRRWGFAPAPQTTTNLVRQDIVLEPNNSGRGFAIMPMQPLDDLPSELRFSGPGLRNEATTSVVARQHRYIVATPAIRSGRQLHAIPNPNRLLYDEDRWRFDAELYESLVFDEARFPKLAQTAAHVVEQQTLTTSRSIDKAFALERHFHSPELYHYSLNLDVPRDPEVDPIEDFVANHRTGHCEYFASALVMMLRSQGIPARLVHGFRGGAYNALGRYYTVQRRHGHSWVEAWLPREEVPEGEVAGVASDGGAWYRLDPTPSADTAFSIAEGGVTERAAQAFDYVELLWRDYVLSLNKARQEDIVYEPLTAQVSVLPSWVETNSARRFIARLSRRLGIDLVLPREKYSPRAFEGSLAMLVIAGIVGLLIVIQILRMVGGGLVQRLGWPSRTAGENESPGFYQRLEKVLSRLPLVRRRGQTPRELAAAAAHRLSGGDLPASELPERIVSAYYRVRFGGDRLDNSEVEAIEQALSALAPAVSQARKQ